MIVENEIEDVEQNAFMNNFIKTVILPEIARKENIKIEDVGKIVGKTLVKRQKDML